MASTKNAQVYEIAILGRITWNLHSLNNEGTVGNVTEPRSLVLSDGIETDGVSGEMLKHVHANYFWQGIQNCSDNLCEACRKFSPEKADANPHVSKTKLKPEQAIEKALTECWLCDIHGFLVQKPTVSRESVVEFGWAVGLPGYQKQSHTHIRRSMEPTVVQAEEEREPGQWGSDICSKEACGVARASDSKLVKVKGKWYCEDHQPEKTAQMIYHRPTRSGTYAVVSVFQPWRIGRNDVSLALVDGIGRDERYKQVLKSYTAMFLRTEGAMTTTRLPHTGKFEGIIVHTATNFPVPVVTPLAGDYIKQVKGISSKIGATCDEFSSLEGFVEKIQALEDRMPWGT